MTNKHKIPLVVKGLFLEVKARSVRDLQVLKGLANNLDNSKEEEVSAIFLKNLRRCLEEMVNSKEDSKCRRKVKI